MHLLCDSKEKEMRAFIIYVCFLTLHTIHAIDTKKKGELENLDSSKESPVSDKVELPSSTSEVPLTSCLPDKSLHSKEDIKTMIDYRVKTLSIYNSINNSYYSEAVAVRDKHINNFKLFLSWFQNRPIHLKHSLEDIALSKRHIEPIVKNVALALKEYPQLQQKYDIELNRTNILFKKLNRYRIICENNCETKLSLRISRRSDFNGYYCSSLEDLDRNIKSKLTQFAKNLSSTMIDRVTYDDKEYIQKIDVLKNKLKDVALKEFGRTMYDILNLQDEYHHFIEDLQKIEANSEVYKIKQTNLQIDAKLLELEQLIEEYGAYCRTCNEISLRSASKKTNRRITFQKRDSKSNDLVDHLLSFKYTEIQNRTNNDYSNTFKELNSLLNSTDSINIYLADLKPIQDEINETLKTQRANFNELKSIAAPSSVTKLIELSTDSKQLLSNIHKKIEHINQILPK